MVTRSSSGADEAFWIDPRAIRFKISPHHDLGPIEGGDWDLERCHPIDALVKHRSIRQRFVEGARWEETELFRDLYRRRFQAGQPVRGTSSIEALAAQYYDRVDGLHADMAREGFLLAHAGKPVPLPRLLIGRHGHIFIGNQGNHRLAIAQVLGLTRFAGKVICRHPLS